MADDYATLADLKKHWAALPAELETDAAQKLHEASVEIRGNYPDVDLRLADGSMDPDVTRLVACRMVKRSLDVADDSPPTGMESFTVGTGPFQFGGKLLNPDGNIYLTAADKRLLGKSRPRKQAWTIPVGRA